jgi:hypothetical protein
LFKSMALPTFRRVSPNFGKHFHPGYLSEPINTSHSLCSGANVNKESAGARRDLVFYCQNG